MEVSSNREFTDLKITNDKIMRLYPFLCFSGGPLYFLYAVIFYLSGNLLQAIVCLVFGCICLLFLLPKRLYARLLVFQVHFQIAALIFMGVTALGWQYGVQQFVICLIALNYISPYKRRSIVLVFAAIEIALFIYLYLTYACRESVFKLPHYYISAIYVFNTVSSFILTLIVSRQSEMTNIASQLQLLDDNQRFKELSEKDTLTEMLNRRPMTDLLEQAWTRYTYDKSIFYVILADIDYFKQINDTYGHDAGDFVVKQTAKIMLDSIRQQDAVCRWGGDEFLFLINGVQSAEKTREIIERIRVKVEQKSFIFNDIELHLTMTFGGSSCLEAKDLQSVIHAADSALYKAKEQGKNRVLIK